MVLTLTRCGSNEIFEIMNLDKYKVTWVKYVNVLKIMCPVVKGTIMINNIL